jgi:hypothetical protein
VKERNELIRVERTGVLMRRNSDEWRSCKLDANMLALTPLALKGASAALIGSFRAKLVE